MIKTLIDLYNWTKLKLPDLIFYSGLIFVFSQLGAVLNFITNLLIVPKYLTTHELGLIAPVTQYVALGALPLGVVAIFVIKFITKFEANNEWGKLKCLTRDLVCLGGVSTLVLTIVFVVSFNSFSLRVGIESKWMLFWMLIHLFVSSWTPLLAILTRSMQRYFIIALGSLLNPLALMICAIVLLPVYGLIGYIIALIVSVAVNLCISVYAIHCYFSPHKDRLQPYFAECKVILRKYLLLFVLSAGSGWLWGFVPPFVVKHFLAEQDAAGYYFIERLALLPTYAVSSLLMILLPILSLKHERKEMTTRTVKATILYTVFSGLIVVCLLYIFSPVVFKLIPQWQDYQEYAKYIWIMAVSVILGNIDAIVNMDFSAKWFFRHVWFRLPISYGLIFLLYCLFGWGAMKGVVPEIIWTYIDENVSRGILLILSIMNLRHFIMLLISWYWCVRIRKDKNVILNTH